ncbi:hypothetical protein GCM10025778_30440 [Paeniglutamicibacter antarcticus]|uniref:Glycosyl transferase family 1 domain-containing protein n=1 Tax=Paeniglutamicibacter antarcticus TaxID=494023 RepID=A0ABP9TQ61_9MICC
MEHKGLDVVLKALKGIDSKVSLDIYGPEEDPAYAALCKELVAGLPTPVSVEFKGTVAPEAACSTLAAYDALLMPTAGENFGHVIAESLSVSCPVFTTPSTPWTEILQSGGGIVVKDREPESWLAAIDRFVALPAPTRAQLRLEAGNAYRSWKGQPQKPHVWTTALQAGQRRR